MMGLTHAIGGATTVLGLNYLDPVFFPLSIWLIILSFYVAQGPDIDIHNSRISKNIYLKPFLFIIGFFISGHRAKETHSFVGTAFYALLSSPFIILFSWGFWLALVLAYFSHIFLDYFNPTGVKLFYIPFLNSNPRSWSLYNTIPQILVEIPYMLKKIFSKRKVERKQIKFDGVGVMTGGSFEKIISIGLWVSFLFLIILNIQALKGVVITDGMLLSIFFPLTLFILLNVAYFNIAIIKKYSKQFKISCVFTFLAIAFLYYGNSNISPYIKGSNTFTLTMLFMAGSLIPLLYLLVLKLYKNIVEIPGDLFSGKENKKVDISDYTILTHILLLILVFGSFYNIKNYNINGDRFITYYNQTPDKISILKDGLTNIKSLYKDSIKKIDKKMQIK